MKCKQCDETIPASKKTGFINLCYDCDLPDVPIYYGLQRTEAKSRYDFEFVKCSAENARRLNKHRLHG